MASGKINAPNGVLLWKNNSPTSNFAAQNVSVNYSGYRALKIFYNLTSSNSRQLSTEIVSLDTGGVLMRLTSDATEVYISSRSFNLTGGTTISFGDCYGAQLSSNGGRIYSVQNNTVIPFAIYGIK